MVFKTRAIFRARRRSRSVRNRASVLKTSYPRIHYFFYWYTLKSDQILQKNGNKNVNTLVMSHEYTKCL
jgi:hypothetical protein